jgi:hypothetical protein
MLDAYTHTPGKIKNDEKATSRMITPPYGEDVALIRDGAINMGGWPPYTGRRPDLASARIFCICGEISSSSTPRNANSGLYML